MSTIATAGQPEVVYPDSDGEPMADNTLQFRWIVTLEGNLEALYREVPDVFVAGDNLIYPVQGRPEIRIAPDVYVAFGRPKGDRGSYRVWDENGIFPQVIFEVLSPGNRRAEMFRKFTFYEQYGAEEYYVYDPDRNTFEAYLRGPDGLQDVPSSKAWVSPRLGIRFDTGGPELVVYRPDGERFLTFQELQTERDTERQRANAERARANVERQRANAEEQRADAERQRAQNAQQEVQRLQAMLRAAGIDPDAAPA